MITRLLAIAGVLLFASVAFSQQPTPGIRKGQRSQPRPQAAAANQQTATDPRGTNESPLIVEVQPTPKTNAETAKEQQKEEEEASSKRWTIGLAVVTAVVGFFQLVLVGIQAYIASKQNRIIDNQSTILRGQETSMRDGLTVARDAAIAAKISADASVVQANFTVAQKRVSDQQLAQMEAGLEVARINAEAAKASADIAAMALEHADRPWIRVDIEPEKLTYSDTEGIQIAAKIILENIGQSVALDVSIWPALVVDLSKAETTQRGLTDRFQKPENDEFLRRMGTALFPRDVITHHYTLGTTAAALNEYWHSNMPDMLDRDLSERIAMLTFLGCVAYRYGTSSRWHYTFWGYEVLTDDGRGLVMQMATGKIPSKPALMRSFFGGLNRAN